VVAYHCILKKDTYCNLGPSCLPAGVALPDKGLHKGQFCVGSGMTDPEHNNAAHLYKSNQISLFAMS